MRLSGGKKMEEKVTCPEENGKNMTYDIKRRNSVCDLSGSKRTNRESTGRRKERGTLRISTTMR